MLHYRLIAMQLAATTSPDLAGAIVGYILQYGLVGLLLLDVTVWHRVVVPRWIMDRLEADWQRERAEKDARIEAQSATITKLTDLAEQQVIPALTRATEVNKDYLTLLQEHRRDGR